MTAETKKKRILFADQRAIRAKRRRGLGTPGNSHSRAASGTPCDFRRSACLHPPGNSHSRILRMLLVIPNASPTFIRHRWRWASVPLAAAGSGPRLGVWGDWSRARPVGPKPSAPSGRRSEAERRELQGAPPAVRLCRLPGSMKRGGTSETERSACATIPFPGLKSPQRSYIAKRSQKKQSGSEARPDGGFPKARVDPIIVRNRISGKGYKP